MEHHTLERDGLHWHVVTSGPVDAPPVLLLHCWTGNWTLWDRTIEALADRYRLITPDHLGFGQSDKPDGDHYQIAAQAERSRFILRHFGYERASIIGHSMGGQIALHMAATYPEAVDQLVVIDPAVSGKLHPLAMPGIFWMGLVRKGLAGFVETAIRLVIGVPAVGLQLMRLYFPDPAAQREAALYWARQLIADGQIHSAAWAEYAITSYDVTPLLPSITAPALTVWGLQDYCVPVSECAVLEANISNIRAVRLPGVGHFPMVEAFPDYIKAVSDFLDSNTAVPRSYSLSAPSVSPEIR